MASAKLTSKGQITIPLEVRVTLGLRAGDRVQFVPADKGEFIISAAKGSIRQLKGFLYKKGRKPVTVKEMNEAIARGAAGLE